jgi:PAS domain S-box-containing protein
MLGYSSKELLSKPYLEFIHPDDLESTIRIINEKLKLGVTVLSFENRYLRKDGGIEWLEWTSQPQVNKNQTYSIARNITERKKTEAELKLS